MTSVVFAEREHTTAGRPAQDGGGAPVLSEAQTPRYWRRKDSSNAWTGQAWATSGWTYRGATWAEPASCGENVGMPKTGATVAAIGSVAPPIVRYAMPDAAAVGDAVV